MLSLRCAAPHDRELAFLLCFSTIRQACSALSVDWVISASASQLTISAPAIQPAPARNVSRDGDQDRPKLRWRLGVQPSKMVIVRAIIDLGRALGLAVVAEGIETEAQRALLAGLGCPIGQGYLFGEPMNATGFAARLAQIDSGGTDAAWVLQAIVATRVPRATARECRRSGGRAGFPERRAGASGHLDLLLVLAALDELLRRNRIGGRQASSSGSPSLIGWRSRAPWRWSRAS